MSTSSISQKYTFYFLSTTLQASYPNFDPNILLIKINNIFKLSLILLLYILYIYIYDI